MTPDSPLGAQIVIYSQQVFAARIGIRDLRSKVEPLIRHAGRVRKEIRLWEKAEKRKTGRKQAILWNSTHYATVLETSCLVVDRGIGIDGGRSLAKTGRIG